MDTVSTGSTITKKTLVDSFLKVELVGLEEKEEKITEEQTQLDFQLDDFKL